MAQSDPVRCLICLSKLVGEVAIPENCDHSFCLDCIMEWSRNNNTCPVDRVLFNLIYQMDCLGGKVKNVVKVERTKSSASEDQIICEKCGRSDFGHLLIMCSTCETGYHINCLTPPLGAVPAQAWMCQECADTHGNVSAEEEVVSDDDIAYLLSEAVPTKSRLRLSTLTSSAASMSSKRSKRLRAQASRHSCHQTNSTQYVPKYLLKSTVPCDINEPSTSSNICSSKLRHKRKRKGTQLQ